MIVRNFLWRKMAVVIDDRAFFRVLVVQLDGRVALKQEILSDKRIAHAFSNDFALPSPSPSPSRGGPTAVLRRGGAGNASRVPLAAAVRCQWRIQTNRRDFKMHSRNKLFPRNFIEHPRALARIRANMRSKLQRSFFDLRFNFVQPRPSGR